MQGEFGVTIRTHALPTAALTKQGWRKAPSVEVNKHLSRGGQVLANNPNQCVRKTSAQALSAHVDDVEAGHQGATGTLSDFKVPVSSALDVVQRF